MLKSVLLSSFILLSIFSFAQKAPAPAYLLGQSFPDSVLQLSLTTTNGSQITFGEVLDTHKGRKIVIDFWASWCKDCVGGMPTFKKLIHKTRKKQVDYVFLSLDKEEGKWKAAIDRLELGGSHYWISQGWKNTLSNYIGLDWIPRYLVIGENGTVVFPKAISASDLALEALLMD